MAVAADVTGGGGENKRIKGETGKGPLLWGQSEIWE